MVSKNAIQPESAASGLSAPVIMKDVHHSGLGGATFIEVRTDGIYLHNENENIDEFFPLNAENHIENLPRIREEVRCHIAKKLSLLVPNLNATQHREVLDYTVGILDTFAHDQEARVRRIIAEELKSNAKAPPEIIHHLLWDHDLSVCGPILEFSPLLNDHHLLDLIASSPVDGVLEAIARRPKVSAEVGNAIILKQDTAATAALLENTGAEFTESMLEFVERRAPDHESWHRPLMLRPEVTIRTINRIAGFVSHTILLDMLEKRMLPEEVQREVLLSVSQRLKNLQLDREKAAETRASELAEHGLLDAEVISDAIEKGEHPFVIAALTQTSGLPKDIVQRMFSTKNPRAITALCWRAGLPMRLSTRMQLKIAQIPHTEVLNAKEGFNYPMTEDEMTAYLAYFAG